MGFTIYTSSSARIFFHLICFRPPKTFQAPSQSTVCAAVSDYLGTPGYDCTGTKFLHAPRSDKLHLPKSLGTCLASEHTWSTSTQCRVTNLQELGGLEQWYRVSVEELDGMRNWKIFAMGSSGVWESRGKMGGVLRIAPAVSNDFDSFQERLCFRSPCCSVDNSGRAKELFTLKNYNQSQYVTKDNRNNRQNIRRWLRRRPLDSWCDITGNRF